MANTFTCNPCYYTPEWLQERQQTVEAIKKQLTLHPEWGWKRIGAELGMSGPLVSYYARTYLGHASKPNGGFKKKKK